MLDLLNAVLPALANLMAWPQLSMLLLGVAIGLVVGVVPGMGGIAGLSLLLPFTFGLEPSAALAMMIGMLAPLHTSDTLPAVLMAIPGTSAAQATVVDGFPMAKRGEAARALSAAFSSSLVGGLVGALVLTFAVFAARPVILAMGFGELLMLTVFALTMVGTLTGRSPIKGVAACGLGLLIGTIGGSPATAEFRMGFGTIYLSDGLPLVVMGLGLFAMPEIVDLLRRHAAISESGKLGKGWIDGLKDTIRNRWLVIRSSILGSLIGILPGLGGSVADWITYGTVVQTSKDKSMFGKGDVRGVIGPEAANNAITGGSLVPTLLFGIPGSGSMAVLLGGFVLIGLQPGPSMLTVNSNIVFTIIWSLAIANVLGAAACFAMAGTVARLTTVPYGLIGSSMLVVIFFGAFQATRSLDDLIALFLIGWFGVLLKRFGWPRPALLIGFVLSFELERSVYSAVQVYGLNFFQRPIVIGIGILILLSIFLSWRAQMRAKAAISDIEMPSARHRIPQIVFTLCVLAFIAISLYDSSQRSWLGAVFPLYVGLITGALVLAIAVFQIFSRKPNLVFTDENLGDPVPISDTYFMLWILGFVLGIALIGFVPASFLLVFGLCRTLVKDRPWVGGFVAAGVAAFLLIMGQVVNLYYPMGLLFDIASDLLRTIG